MKTRSRILLERRFSDWSTGKKCSAMMAAALLGLVVTAEPASAQGNGGLAAVSGDDQTVVANTKAATLMVSASSLTPCEGVAISWTITSGSGTLDFTETTTDNGCMSSNTLTVAPSSNNRIDVMAVRGPLASPIASVTFTINVLPAAPPTASQAATEGLKSALPMANIAVTTANVQLTNLGLRLSSLRQGARGVNISGLSLAIKKDWVADADFGGAFIGEGRWPGEPDTNGPARPSLQTALAPLLPGGPTGAGASAEGSLWGGLGIFINGQGSFGDQSTTSREPGFDFHTAGVTVGADYRFTERLVLGTAVGYLATDSELNGNAGESDARGVSVSAFGTYYVRNQFYLEGIATYGWNDYDTERTIDVNSSAKGETHGNQLALSAGGGYDFNFGRLTLGAQARATYIKVEVSGYTEHGPSMFNLNVGSQTVESVTTALGGQATYAIGTAWGVLSPTVRAEWEHEYKDDSPIVRGTLVVDPAGTGFLVRGNTPDRDYFNLGAGLSMTFRRGTSGFVFYETVVGRSDITNHLFAGGIRLEF